MEGALKRQHRSDREDNPMGTAQRRSTYPMGDVDWIRFNAVAGTIYRI
ncbi:MAG: hypothetical protein Q7V14_03490 [Coriobacteriia bacterium]|nr:hypothetical protein [Coriobacteriia bacterium]